MEYPKLGKNQVKAVCTIIFNMHNRTLNNDEIKFVAIQLSRAFGANSQFDYLKDKNAEEKAAEMIREMPDEKKRFIALFVCATIMSDGVIEDCEKARWNEIRKACGFPSISIKEGAQMYKKEFGA